MLDAGGGGGGGTPWALLTVDKMYALIKSADTDKQWKLADGWKKSAELIASHRFQVQDYRDNLASAWPPGKSQAAAAYLDRLDVMIASLTETYEAALQNYDAVVAATGSLYQAQVQMEKIYQEYKNNETLLANFAAKQQEQQNNPTPTPSPSPSGGEQPPVANGRQEALRLQASTMLNGVSTDLAQAQARIARPKKYEPAKSIDGGKEINEGDHVPPPIPPITPSYSEGTSTRSSRPATTLPGPTGTATPPVISPPSAQPGLVLGGTNPPSLAPSNGVISPLSPSVPSGPGPIGTTGPLAPTTGLLPGGGTPTPSTGRGINMPREGMLKPSLQTPEGMRGMPPGGVIGSAPVGLGQPASGRNGTARVNPIGGVINGTGGVISRPGDAAGGNALAHAGGVYGQGATRRPGQREDPNSTHWDPDNPWETAEGVDPVVLPQREKRIDPGPAIGL